MKFDALIGRNWPTRILQGVSREELDAYCAANGLRIATDRAIGLVYREVLLAKDETPAERYADELFDLHGSAEQVEAHMESEGYSDEEVFVQLRRLGLRRVYVRETASPQ
jgi:hypothetical protein